jgi:hypothetical protein
LTPAQPKLLQMPATIGVADAVVLNPTIPNTTAAAVVSIPITRFI